MASVATTRSSEVEDVSSMPPELRDTWDGRFRRWFQRILPWKRLLPDTEPVYVKSLLYVFGVLNIASLAVLTVSGIVLAVLGPDWWLHNSVGRFFDAVHFWAVEVFFLVMFIHLLAVFFSGAFRGRRGLTWILGVLAFLFSAVTGLTGYTIVQDFDAQWVATQARDAINATGLGNVVNLLNTGQVTTMHLIVLPLLVIILVVVHVLMVRVRGAVPPYDALEDHLETEVAK